MGTAMATVSSVVDRPWLLGAPVISFVPWISCSWFPAKVSVGRAYPTLVGASSNMIRLSRRLAGFVTDGYNISLAVKPSITTAAAVSIVGAFRAAWPLDLWASSSDLDVDSALGASCHRTMTALGGRRGRRRVDWDARGGSAGVWRAPGSLPICGRFSSFIIPELIAWWRNQLFKNPVEKTWWRQWGQTNLGHNRSV